MTTTPNTPSHDAYAELVAGHALAALDEHDERRLADHLTQCAPCRTLLTELSGVAAELGHAEAHPTPAGLDRAIRDSIRTPAMGPTRARSARPARWAGVAVAASVAAILAAVATWPGASEGQPRQHIASAEAALRCERDPQCEPVPLSASDGAARAIALLRPSGASLLVEGLEANDRAAETYVLWQQSGTGSMAAIATFDVSERSGIVALALVGQPAAGRPLAISREPGRAAPASPSRALLTSSSVS